MMNKPFNHVLLVDDDTITNFVNESLLQELDVADQIISVYNGVEALDFVEKYWRQSKENSLANACRKLILLDINMPIMNGFEFLDHFEKAEQPPEVCVVLLSSSVNKKDMDKAKQHNVKAYIEKPLNKDKLQGLINRLK